MSQDQPWLPMILPAGRPPGTARRRGGPGEPRADRPYDERPFFWGCRVAIERIRRATGGGQQAAFGMAVYTTLLCLASEQANAGDVQAQIKVIAALSGLRYRKTMAVLTVLDQEAHVIRVVDRPGDWRGNLYRILSLRDSPAVSGNSSKANPCRLVRTPPASPCVPGTHGFDKNGADSPKVKGTHTNRKKRPGRSKARAEREPASPDQTHAPRESGYVLRLAVAADVAYESVRAANVSEDGEVFVVELSEDVLAPEVDRITRAAEAIRLQTTAQTLVVR